MAGFKIVFVNVAKNGEIDMEHLRKEVTFIFYCSLRNKYMLFTELEVRIGKYFPRSQKRPEAEGRGTFLRPREIFPYTDRPKR